MSKERGSLGFLRLLVKLGCLVLMGYVGYLVWHLDPAQTMQWARSDYPWIRDVSRVVVALVAAIVVGGLAWKILDGVVSIFEK